MAADQNTDSSSPSALSDRPSGRPSSHSVIYPNVANYFRRREVREERHDWGLLFY